MQELKKENTKILFLSFLVFLGLFVLLLRVAYLQLIGRTEYVKRVAERFSKVALVDIPTYRGSIKDRNGNDLAMSIPTISVYAFPKYVQNKEELASRLSAATGVPENKILERLNSGKKFVWLVKKVDKNLLPYIKGVIKDTENSRYVGIQEDFKRFYPHGNLASNLLGFSGDDGIGLEGLEYMLNPFLNENKQKIPFLFSPEGSLALEYSSYVEALNLKTVYTTIDLGVQSILEDIRDKIVKDWKPKRVAILIMDTKNGDILGMATYPYYDPNNYNKYKPWERRNFVITDLFEPGSVMKPFFIGMALDRGYISEHYTVDGENGKTEVYGRIIRDVHPYGRLTLDEVLIKSSNVGTVKIAKFLSRKDVEELMQKIHFKDSFGILPGEVKPKLPDYRYSANIVYSSIGQGLSANLLNLCSAFSLLATGYMPKPRIILYTEDEEGKRTYYQSEIIRQGLFSERVMKWLHKNLIKVVEEGTAKLARSDYFTIAGKTGTSQKFDFSLGRYSRDKVVAYFVGYFPATDPRFVAGISVDEPKGLAYGGTAAAPYFKEMVERVSAYYKLKPDKMGKSASELRRKQ
ncbi:MAG: peptidoglycan D,D-transpeptidase FtsI family protein [Hydrogenobacter sp.]